MAGRPGEQPHPAFEDLMVACHMGNEKAVRVLLMEDDARTRCIINLQDLVRLTK
jgi:hypothetical protein